ncbi:uncharacterized protein LOC100489253 isoform X2 [Xenopus tropicalis]|uniref:Uncharacterized protein LOC100489253 isoform X2 n=1 Tax=Xenopus tropicalis TaxID=8364 RepID=A0A8J1JFJ6_XENTR|nr:uncharacterized protein LOC100489253 isoform X2 [Xenopus tropicalis]
MKHNMKKYTLIAEKYYELFDEEVYVVAKLSKGTKEDKENEFLKAYRQFNEALDDVEKRGTFPTSRLANVPEKIGESLLKKLSTFKETLHELRRKAELLLLKYNITPKKNDVRPPDTDNKEDVTSSDAKMLRVKNLKRNLKMNRLLGEKYYDMLKEQVKNLTWNVQIIDNDTIEKLKLLYSDYQEALGEAKLSGSIYNYRFENLPENMKESVMKRYKTFTDAMDELDRRGRSEIMRHIPPSEKEEKESDNSASERSLKAEEKEKNAIIKAEREENEKRKHDNITATLFVIMVIVMILTAIGALKHFCTGGSAA